MTFKIKCDQCNPMAINTLPTHEIGCPNTMKKWVFNTDDMICSPGNELGSSLEINSLVSRSAYENSMNTKGK